MGLKYNFTIRLYNNLKRKITGLGDINFLTISGITIISKPYKFGDPCFYKGNTKKYKYSLKLNQDFSRIAGSHNYPILAFKGDFLDIDVENFPRYPAFYQEMSAAKSNMSGYGYINFINQGFPIWLLYRKIEFLNIKIKK